MSTLIKTIVFDYDFNRDSLQPTIKKKPYLVRIYNWDSSEPNELRVDEKELNHLYSMLKKKNCYRLDNSLQNSNIYIELA